MKRPKIMGLTGGIGSGKSTVAQRMRENGIPVLDADAFSRRALEIGEPCYDRVVELFGPRCLREDRTVDRAYVAKRIFSDETLRNALNAIVHPYVLERMREQTAQTDAPWVVWEVPLLFESGLDALCDSTAAVLCKEAVRVKRVCLRDGVSREEAKARIRAQMTDRQRCERAQHLLHNDGTRNALIEQTDALYRWMEEL